MNTIGLDLSKTGLVAAWPGEGPPAAWPVLILNYDDPNWYHRLIELIDGDDAIITAEPTGSHLLQPVASVIALYRPLASLYLVSHSITGHYRSLYVSSAKNDRLDAIAIALIARDIRAGKPPRGVRRHDMQHETLIETLRLHVNAYVRLRKERGRIKNRLNILSASIWPSLPASQTYHRAAALGYITPAQIIALINSDNPPPPYNDRRALRHLRALAEHIPPITVPHAISTAIRNLHQQLETIEHQEQTSLNAILQIIESEPLGTITRRWKHLASYSPIYAAAIHVATHGQTLTLTKDEFKASVGTSPLTNTSGDGTRTRTTPRGYTPAKQAMYLWTMNLIKPSDRPNAVRDYYNNGHNIYAARTKLARILWGMARDPSLDAEPDNDQPEENGF